MEEKKTGMPADPEEITENTPGVSEDEPCAQSVDPAAAEEETREKRRLERKQKFWKEVREWVVSLVSAILVVLVLRSFLFTIIKVDGTSMANTLMDGERLFVTVYDAKFGEVERGDVVICHYPNRGRTNFVKRVVGVPGDTVYRQNGVTFVLFNEDGQDYINPLDPNRGLSYFTASSDYEPYVLGEDEYFVVGDNRYNSHDSRDWNDSDPSKDVGPISKDMIIGHVRQVIWPLDAFRTVE